MAGRIRINYPRGGWWHPHSALAFRATPGQPDAIDLFFQAGSDSNYAVTKKPATLSSDIGVRGTLRGDSVYRVTLTDRGGKVTGTNLTRIATGLRNAAGFAIHPATGDLYLQDNGIDGFSDSNEPHSADELNIIPAAQIGYARFVICGRPRGRHKPAPCQRGQQAAVFSSQVSLS